MTRVGSWIEAARCDPETSSLRCDAESEKVGLSLSARSEIFGSLCPFLSFRSFPVLVSSRRVGRDGSSPTRRRVLPTHRFLEVLS